MGEREPVIAEALNLGGAVHKTLENYYNQVKDGKEWTVAEACNEMDKNIEDYKVPWLSKDNKVKAEKQHTELMSGLASKSNQLAKFMEDKQVVACEKDFIWKFPMAMGILYNGKRYNEIYIIGSIDLIVKDKDGGLIAIDYKSGKRLFDNKKLKTNLQLPIYSLVIRNIYGRLPVQTRYYFTRLDKFQDVDTLVYNDSDCKVVRFKSGKRKGQIKYKQRTVQNIFDVLIDIFTKQYCEGCYRSNPTPLCSWCALGKYEKDNCKYAMEYIRKDIDLPKQKVVNRLGGRRHKKSND